MVTSLRAGTRLRIWRLGVRVPRGALLTSGFADPVAIVEVMPGGCALREQPDARQDEGKQTPWQAFDDITADPGDAPAAPGPPAGARLRRPPRQTLPAAVACLTDTLRERTFGRLAAGEGDRPAAWKRSCPSLVWRWS